MPVHIKDLDAVNTLILYVIDIVYAKYENARTTLHLNTNEITSDIYMHSQAGHREDSVCK